MQRNTRKEKIYKKLQELCPKGGSISENDRIYHDLNISGFDFYELMDYIFDEFKVDFSSMNMDEYVPAEGAPIFSNLAALLRGGYREIRVKDLLDSVEKGKWDDSFSSSVSFK